MPLTEYQSVVARLLATQRTPDSHLAGGAALHIEPNSIRYSNDLDYFNDSVERVASAFDDDRRLLEAHGHTIRVVLQQVGFVRAIVSQDKEATKVEWAHETAWRFLPPIRDDRAGFRLHPIDLAINKILALVGRNEARDFLDTLHVHSEVLGLGALCWAASGKDPGFTPATLLALLRRRGVHRPEEYARLRLLQQPDPVQLKERWLAALESAAAFVSTCPPTEVGCLYYASHQQRFVSAISDLPEAVPHFGRPGGVLPLPVE